MTGQELIIKHDKEALAKAFKIPQSSIVWMGGRKYACVIKEEETIVVNHPRSKLAIIGLVNELKAEIAEGKNGIHEFKDLDEMEVWNYYEGVSYVVTKLEKLLGE